MFELGEIGTSSKVIW